MESIEQEMSQEISFAESGFKCVLRCSGNCASAQVPAGCKFFQSLSHFQSISRTRATCCISAEGPGLQTAMFPPLLHKYPLEMFKEFGVGGFPQQKVSGKVTDFFNLP